MCGQTPSEIYIKPLVLNGTLCALSFASVILMWTKHFIYIIHRFIYRSTEVPRCILFVQFLCMHIKYFPMISNDLWWFSNSLSLAHSFSSFLHGIRSYFIFLNIAFFFISFFSFEQSNNEMISFIFGLGKTPEMATTATMIQKPPLHIRNIKVRMGKTKRTCMHKTLYSIWKCRLLAN